MALISRNAWKGALIAISLLFGIVVLLQVTPASAAENCQGSYSAFQSKRITSCVYRNIEYHVTEIDTLNQRVNLVSYDLRSGDPASGLRIDSLNTISIVNLQTGGVVTPSITGQTTTGAQTTAATPPSKGDGSKSLCDGTPIFGSFSFAACLSGLVYIFTVGIASPFAYIASVFFEYAVSMSLAGMTYATPIIANGWTVIRDIANMAFLFALIYIAFSLILNLQGFETKKFLTRVIVVALVVNFSFFISRIVIDAGNLLALTFYNQIAAPSDPSGKSSQQLNLLGINMGPARKITSGIMQGLELQKVIGNQSFDQFKKDGTFFEIFLTLSFIFIAMGALLAILAYAFLTAGIKFIARIVVLWITIIFSPLAFVAWIFPFTTKYAEQWWDNHIRHALFPAAFLFIFFILSSLMIAITNEGDNGLFGSTFNAILQNPSGGIKGLADAIMIIGIRMAFIVALILIAVKAGDSFGVVGSNFATSVGQWAKGKTLGVYTKGLSRAGGWTYKQTVGRGASALDDKLGSTRFGSGWVGYELRKLTTKPVKESSVGGAESYTAYKDRTKEEKRERAGERRDIENRQILVRAGKGWAGPDAAHEAKDKDRIKNFTKRELEALDPDELKEIAHLLNEDQVKDIGKFEKLTDTQKQEIRIEWHNKSTSAPVQKANKHIQELRDIEQKLRFGGGIGAADLDDIIQGTTAGTTLTDDRVKKMIENANKQLSEARTKRDTAPTSADRTIQNQNMINLQEAVNVLRRLEDERKKVPPEAGGAAAPGQFVVA